MHFTLEQPSDLKTVVSLSFYFEKLVLIYTLHESYLQFFAAVVDNLKSVRIGLSQNCYHHNDGWNNCQTK